jgi:hypothetical protein
MQSFVQAGSNMYDDQQESEGLIKFLKERAQPSIPATGGAECLKTCRLEYKESNSFTKRDLKPVVPTDQVVGLGNRFS